jgi:hypothetical protein
MSAKESDLKNQAKVILDALALLAEGIAFTPFEQCQPLNRKFDNIRDRPVIYIVMKMCVLQYKQFPTGKILGYY